MYIDSLSYYRISHKKSFNNRILLSLYISAKMTDTQAISLKEINS